MVNYRAGDGYCTACQRAVKGALLRGIRRCPDCSRLLRTAPKSSWHKLKHKRLLGKYSRLRA